MHQHLFTLAAAAVNCDKNPTGRGCAGHDFGQISIMGWLFLLALAFLLYLGIRSAVRRANRRRFAGQARAAAGQARAAVEQNMPGWSIQRETAEERRPTLNPRRPRA